MQSLAQRKTGHAGMGHGYSRSVLESQSSIFLQAMGRSSPVPAALAQAEEESRANARRSHLGRDAKEFSESVNEKPQDD